uniref:ABC transporter ATP-binding protein n=1 Tax=uncultured Rhizobium sp. TaxID=155567 RepID=UPI00260E95C4|nr:sn-glycerol-3-phosphate ABC transporter ATP-binding protein UgpC [uncultured Rhizobium sp.]
MAQVSLRYLKKSYGTMPVMHGVSFEVADGEFVALVGPSGCGKSTLLRMIAGLEDITDGTISIAGRVVNDVEPKERDLAMVFQNYALYPHKNVADNMGFPLKLKGAPKSEIEAKVRKAADILDLGKLLDRYPKQLSGGQRQRVAMGRAIVRDPQVFLFDEPLSNLDAKLRVTMRVEIKELHQRLKTTTIYVTHDQIEAMTMADKIVVMRDGLVAQIGAPLELYDNPQSIFVAGFIGSPSMNLLKGTFGKEGDADVFRLGAAGTLRIPETVRPAPGTAGIYGIRPEHLAISTPGNGIVAKVLVVEPLGPEIQLTMQLGDQTLVAVFRDRIDVQPDSELWLSPQISRVCLFDAEGKRLAA